MSPDSRSRLPPPCAGRCRSWRRRRAAGAARAARIVREAAGAGLLLAVATTGSREAVEALVRADLGPAGPALFRLIGEGVAVNGKTPPPEIYGPLLERLGCEPEEAVAFASSPERSSAAAAAGLGVIVTPSAYTPRRRFPGARLVLSGLGDEGHPFRVLSGEALGRRWVTVEAIRAWHAAWTGHG